MVSASSLTALAALLASAAADLKTCSGDLPFSCQNSTEIEDTCCFVSAGQLVLTQFWDTDPVTGPTDSWTIHGLWPDWCDGSYPSNCDSDRAYTNISDILSSGGGDQVLSEMEIYWKDYQGDDESFWEHEWSKHGTCVSTLEPDCYAGYEPTEEVVDYFNRTVSLFKTLPTYEWLAEAGITPGSGYNLDEIQSVLDGKHGATVVLGCDGDELNEVWYYYNVKGSLQEGQFTAVDPSGGSSSCPDEVQYTSKGSRGNSTMAYSRMRSL